MNKVRLPASLAGTSTLCSSPKFPNKKVYMFCSFSSSCGTFLKQDNMRAVLLAVALLVACASAEFHLSRAITGVYYSKAAYCDHTTLNDWSCSVCPHFPGVTNVSTHIDLGHQSQGFVAYNPTDNEIVYAFRGTVNLDGWIEDFDFFQTPYNATNCTGCKVHEGLWWGYNALAVHLLPKLQELVYAYPSADIFVTGHSMGAAQAGYAFLDVLQEIKGHTGKKRMYNFGCPRLGNPAFVAWADQVLEPHQEHFRMTNFGDPVVHLPPIVFDEFGLGNWLHMPREVFFMNPFAPPQGGYKICDGTVTHEDPTCADSTPWYDMIGFQNHTTYLDIGLGCFLGPAKGKSPFN